MRFPEPTWVGRTRGTRESRVRRPVGKKNKGPEPSGREINMK